ncbi:MAG: class II aldolase/adducin family protein, partial [Alphaproteobacteria bacterium]
LRIHEHLRRQDAPQSVVLHTHPTELIALSHLPDCREQAAFNRALWCVHPEVKYNLPRGVGLVPYTMPGTEALAQATVDVFRRGYPVALWQWHGCVAIGADVGVAFDLIHIANKAAKINLLCRAAGFAPEGLTDAQLSEFARAFDLEE